MTRQALPHRRPALTAVVAFAPPGRAEASFTVTAGFDPRTGALSEVFYSDGMKSGTDLQHTIGDACVIVSVALQHGVPLADLSRSLGRDDDGRPASILGALIGALVEMEGAQ